MLNYEKTTMVTQDVPNGGRIDYNDSFARYLANVSPNLMHETSDISCISKMTTSGPNTKPMLFHGNIAEELNNFDTQPPRPATTLIKSSTPMAPRLLNQHGNDPAAILGNSQMTARFSQFATQHNYGQASTTLLNSSNLLRSHSSLSKSQILTQSQKRPSSQLIFTQ